MNSINRWATFAAQSGSGYDNTSTQQDQPTPHPGFTLWRQLALGFVVLAVIGFILSKTTGLFDNLTDKISSGDNKTNPLTADGVHIRSCTNVESMCNGMCRGPNGQVTGPNAKTSDGMSCCQFGCEEQAIAVRACKTTEALCDVGQACKMGDTIQIPAAITPGGRSCCRFGCDDGTDIPIRTPYSSETVCPVGSYCLDYQGKATAPRAIMKNGSSICGYSQSDNPCISV